MTNPLKRGVIFPLALMYFALIFILPGCGNDGNGYLTGVQDRKNWFQEDPYGMVYIPMGSFNMGPSDQDVTFGVTSQSKTVSLPAYYMDQTEITNNEYRQFVNWVRDSIARRMIGEENEDFLITADENGTDYPNPILNWDEKFDYDEDDYREILEPMFLPENERFYGRKEFDTRKFLYEYWWIDYQAAARRGNRAQGLKDRSVFIKRETIPIYPDTLAWIHDFTYSYNEPLTNMYFWHPGYDDYPVVGINWKQANAFCVWRTNLRNGYLFTEGESYEQNYRLPTESEWEYAARGGLDLSPYPWGGPYIRNSVGCFLANFKPLRGNYIDDGGLTTLRADSYNPNEYGLYCMSGNVAEWTSNAYDESAYNFSHDNSPDYTYEAKNDDPIALKRKVIRGGSWKDVSYFLQAGTRTYEYQDTSKCYIGFRCVISYIGRDKNDVAE
ncbi:MAG TPA: SUMF1/EgtB/PvdO family nonheme iron enzyme [Flavobacteriales bacterium]|nr:SUMF1/EgtB/PvdO family nonheme iron enzyme [Flavobacteriales bacterium]